MKTSVLLFLFICLANTAFGRTYYIDREVLLRVPGTQATKKEVRRLTGLTIKNGYESKHFKIVIGKGDEAIKFRNPDKQLQLRAATVYYHLTKARDYWVKEIGSERAKNLHQLVIRLEITNAFSDIAHYMSDNLPPEYNNALSIPAGTPPDFVPNGKAWDQEIWFRPMKRISTASLDSDIGDNPLTQRLKELKGPIQDYAQGQLEATTLQALFWDSYQGPYWKDALWIAGTFAMMRVLIGASSKMDRLFLTKWYYLDTAMVPEVVFHEYAHIILSDHMSLSHSTAVGEGMADYFAASIANNYLVYGSVPGHSNARAKDGLNKNPYRHYMEHPSQAQSDFVISILWRIKAKMPEVSNKLIYNSRAYLKTESSTIYDSLLRALLKSCRKVCEKPFRDRNKLYNIFKEKGL